MWPAVFGLELLIKARVFVSTLVRAACALHWPHPGIWAAARHLRKERERACDDAALRAGVDPHGYASCLLELAAAGRAGRRMPSTALAMVRGAEERTLNEALRRAGADLERRWAAVITRRS